MMQSLSGSVSASVRGPPLAVSFAQLRVCHEVWLLLPEVLAGRAAVWHGGQLNMGVPVRREAHTTWNTLHWGLPPFALGSMLT